MATEIKQGVKYVIEADDKASKTAETAAENVGKYSKKAQKEVSDAAEKSKKKLEETNVVANAFKDGIKKLGGAVGNLVPAFTKLGAAGAAAFGAIGLAVQAVYKVIRFIVDGVSELIEDKFGSGLDKVEAKIDGITASVERFERSMADAEDHAEKAARSRQLQLESIDKMTRAQIEYNRQQALALATTEKERDAVNEIYDDKLAEAQESAASASRAERRRQIEEEIHRSMEAEREYRDAGHDAEMTAGDLSARMRMYENSMELDEARKISKAHEKALGEARKFRSKTMRQKARTDLLRDELAALDTDDEVAGVESAARKLKTQNQRSEKARKEAEDAARVKSEAEAKAQAQAEREREKAAAAAEREEAKRQDMLARQAKEDAAEIARAQKEAAQALHRQKMRNLADEKELEKAALKEQADAEKRLAAARSAVSQAWGWYRNKDSMKAQLDEEKAQAEAEKQFEKDFGRLRMRSDWRTAKNLSVDQEAVRRLALAKEEEGNAQKAVIETAEHARAAAASLAAIEAELTQEGE